MLVCYSAGSVVPSREFELDYHEFVRRDTATLTWPGRYSLRELLWMAPVLSGGGYCSEATALLLGMMELGHVRVSAAPHGDAVSTNYIRGLPPLHTGAINSLIANPPVDAAAAIVVCHSEPGAWHLSEALPQRYATSFCPARAAYRIGRTMFETDRLPDGWVQRLNAMDEVWVPSAYSLDVFRAGGVDASKLLVVPEAVDTREFDPALYARNPPFVPGLALRANCNGTKANPPTVSCPFRFFSVGKWERRKNFEGLLRAYLTEFMQPRSDAAGSGASSELGYVPAVNNVELYILTSAYHSTSDFDEAVQRLIRTELRCTPADEHSARPCVPEQLVGSDALPPVKLLTDIRQVNMPALYAAMDAFVLPSRGEGWGRPHVEAMAMGLPVIATLWSGPSEFMTEHNSYPLRHSSMEPIPDGPFAGHMQAEPDLTHLRQLMRQVYTDPAAALQRGARARQDMVATFSPTAVAGFVSHQVHRITQQLSAPASIPFQGPEATGNKDEL